LKETPFFDTSASRRIFRSPRVLLLVGGSVTVEEGFAKRNLEKAFPAQ